MNDYNSVEEHDHYRISTSNDGEAIMFAWKESPGLSASDFADGITVFATHCTTHDAVHGVIDARLETQLERITSELLQPS